LHLAGKQATDRRVEGWLRNGWMGGLKKLRTLFSGWAGLQKLITDLDRFYPYRGV